MQKFTYHCHNSFKGVFDGRDTIEDMISAAENKGFDTIGISNHCIYHPTLAKMPYMQKQNFSDLDQLIDIHKQCFEEIDKAAANHKIKVLKGLEVDFFPSKEWRKSFEKIKKELNADYYISATHFIRNKDESFMCGIYFLNTLPSSTSKEDIKEFVSNYWDNITESIKSGYFDFLAHPDYCCQFNLGCGEEWVLQKQKMVEALADKKMACEVNTNGIRRIGRPYPDWWLVQAMIAKDIPLLISDDAHYATDIGSHFADVEAKLSQMGCQKRFCFNK